MAEMLSESHNTFITIRLLVPNHYTARYFYLPVLHLDRNTSHWQVIDKNDNSSLLHDRTLVHKSDCTSVLTVVWTRLFCRFYCVDLLQDAVGASIPTK